MSSATIVNSLASLREHYTAMLSESEHQANFAKEQLNHLNALLLDQMLPVGNIPTIAPAPVSIQATLAPAPEEEIPVVRVKPVSAPEPEPAPRKVTRSGRKQFLRETALPLLRPYVGLTKTDAVAKVMEDHSGQIIYLDDVIKILHGELDAVTLRQERARMRNLMWRGADRGLWDKVKGQESAYTYKASLLTPDSKVKGKSGRAARLKVPPATPAPLPVEAKPVTTKATRAPKAVKAPKAAKSGRVPKAAPKTAAKATKPTKPTVVKVLPKAGRGKKAAAMPELSGGASLMGSVEKVLQANKGKPMTADEIAVSLYGEMERGKLADVKKQISDRLAKGVKYKRWQRVANKIGVYMYA